ncbi:hypothetical protein HG530_013870 [Fusarium avenaceum]|nr:hypothetical protein HG530_013870 [Fusarium avenaceum]
MLIGLVPRLKGRLSTLHCSLVSNKARHQGPPFSNGAIGVQSLPECSEPVAVDVVKPKDWVKRAGLNVSHITQELGGLYLFVIIQDGVVGTNVIMDVIMHHLHRGIVFDSSESLVGLRLEDLECSDLDVRDLLITSSISVWATLRLGPSVRVLPVHLLLEQFDSKRRRELVRVQWIVVEMKSFIIPL